MADDLNSDEKDFISFTGFGEMQERVQKVDWTKTSLGAKESWPQSLRTTLSIILSSKFPMFLFWGPELLCFYNDAYRPSLGNEGKHPSALGKPGVEVWPEIWEFIKPIIDKVMVDGQSSWYEDQYLPIYRNGTMEDVYWTFSYSPVNDESGKPNGVFVTCFETTQKVLNLKDLKESKSQLEFAIDAAELATWDFDPIANKFTANARYSDWFGIPAEHDTDNDLALAVIADEDRQRVITSYMAALDYSLQSKYDIIYTIRPKDRPQRTLRAKGKVWFDENKIAYRFNGTLEDVTAEATAEKEIFEAKESSLRKFEQIANTLPQIVWTATPDGNLDYFNDQWFYYSGLDFDQSVGQGWASTIHPDDLPELAQTWEYSLINGVPYEVEARIRNADNIYNWALIRALPVKDNNDIIHQWCGTCTLIQEQKESEQKLLELSSDLAAANEEITSTNEDLVKLNNQLVRVNSDMDNFIYTASHDLKAPISNIEGLIVALTKHINTSPTVVKLLSMIHASIERFKKTLADLTEITKLQRLDREDETIIDINGIIEDIKLDLSTIIEESKGKIELELNGIREIKFSSKNFRSIFYNLISNSLKYRSPERDPFILITLKEDAAFYKMTIKDNGLGMDLTNKNSIFGMFKRLHNHVEGSGIGLFIVKKIIDNAGGKIEVESKVGEGSDFTLFFNK